MIAGPPFRYGANPDTLLDVSDLVFIDAPTTGLSRAIGKAETKDFFGVDKDLDAFTADDPALPDQIRPLEQPEVHHRRKLRHDCAPRACPIRCRQAASSSTASCSSRPCSTSAAFAVATSR